MKDKEPAMSDIPEPRVDQLQNVKNLPPDALTPELYKQLTPQLQYEYILKQRNAADTLMQDNEKMLAHIEDLNDEDVRNRTWEANHRRITYAIALFVHNRGRMPTQNEIVRDANLSRQTVQKHMKEYHKQPMFNEHLNYFQFMTHRVMGVLLQRCMDGNVNAIKMYMDMMSKTTPLPGHLPQGHTFINNNQHNYMQINNTVLNQQVIQELSPEQLSKIEEIINGGKEKQD